MSIKHDYLKICSLIVSKKRYKEVFFEVRLNKSLRIDLLATEKNVGIECLTLLNISNVKSKLDSYYEYLDKIIFCSFKRKFIEDYFQVIKYLEDNLIDYEIWLFEEKLNNKNLTNYGCSKCLKGTNYKGLCNNCKKFIVIGNLKNLFNKTKTFNLIQNVI